MRLAASVGATLIVAGWLSLVAAAPAASPAPRATATHTSARAHVPVVLVPGWFDTARELAALRISLLRAGVPYVETLTFEEPTGSNRRHAEEIDSVVEQVLAETGASEVDIVAHSMGGLATRWYLKTRADAPVRRAVFIASPHRGTRSALLAWGDGREEMLPESEFLRSLNGGALLPDGVAAMTISTPIDTHVLPGESATLPGVEDHTVCCPTHQGLLRSDDVFYLVLDFLDRTATTATHR
ncbi:MAG: alpha/beta fold hydrolase [Gemmatimonadetes bacterium]|nr:alpha/beta fold hydrolase [Gemmatimonadota bacterium]